MKITHSTSDITKWFFDTLESLIQTKKIVTIGLAGGTSCDNWYAELLESDEWSAIETSHIRWCVTDERVNSDISDRNDAHIWDVFMSPLCQKSWSQEEYFIRPTMESNGKEYSERVGEIDIAFFGMGPDGHTASLFPNHVGLQSEEL
jgi:6-phosphogluconolactonase/glucosamine-6-phosphate isomerase/deaminase